MSDFTTARYDVTQIYEVPTKASGITQYQIALHAVEPHVSHTIVTTIDPWKASLCERAKALHIAVTITRQKTRYGHNLTRIVLHDERPIIERLVPHDGELGLSAWVSCQAPECVLAHRAIQAGQSHVVDFVTNQHWHVECFTSARGAVLLGRADSDPLNPERLDIDNHSAPFPINDSDIPY